MGSVYLTLTIVSLLFSIIAYTSSDNLIMAISVFAVFTIYFFFIGARRIKKWKSDIDRYHLCYNLINTLIISINIKKTISGAFESTEILISENKEIDLDSFKHFDVIQKIEYLEKYFPFKIYKLFIEVIKLYEEQGGDILKMSDNLIKATKREEDYVIAVSEKSKRKLFEISLLWLFTFLILIFVRFGLANFFASVIAKPFFLASIAVFFLFVLVSVEFIFRNVFNSEMKVRDYDE